MIPIDNEQTFRHALTGEYNLFVGAGFSVHAQGALGNLPVGDGLKPLLSKRFGYDVEKYTLPMMCDMAKAYHPDEFREFLTNAFTVTSYDPRYNFLRMLVPKMVLTTNIDNLINKIFEDHDLYYLHDIIENGTNFTTHRAIPLLQIHGSVIDSERELVFGHFEVGTNPLFRPIEQSTLQHALLSRPTLIWGSALNDASTIAALRDPRVSRNSIPNAWVQIFPDGKSEELCKYWRTMGFKCIVATTEQLLEYLDKFSRDAPGRQAHSTSISNIPTKASIKKRPIEKFFLGAAPTFGDIYRNVIIKTEIFDRIIESLRSGNDVLLSGIPGSGKTTLLMQVALELNMHEENVFFTERLDLQMANTLARKIGERKGLAIVDNISTDARSLKVLKTCSSLQVLCADRDIPLSSIRGHLTAFNFDIIDVTQQSALDLRRIWDSIPARIKSSKFKDVQTSRGTEPSLYEFVIRNVENSSMAQRITTQVNGLCRTDPPMAELLILACYLNSCSSILSSDVALGYFKTDNLSYEQLMDMIDSVGQLICEEYPDSTVDDMDYFGARSRIVANEVMRKVPGSILGDVIRKLFLNVPPQRIDNYKYFKRFAYDAKLFYRAFPDVWSGIEFYDQLIERFGDSYISQQKALYLSLFGLYDEAFEVIDNVRSNLHPRLGKNFTIHNTFYKIQFYMNIENGGLNDTPMITGCLEALEGIKGCFRSDIKKGQHAMLYADCALRFADSPAVETDLKIEVLKEAKAMLNEVIRSESFLYRPPRLLRDIKTKLRSFGVL